MGEKISATKEGGNLGQVIWPVPPNGPNGTYVFSDLQDFGPRNLTISPYHNGLDFGVPANTAIASIAAGYVLEKQPDPGKQTALGNFIHIQHDGFQSRYCHMRAGSHSHLQETNYVAQGGWVGDVGNTGTLTTGAHLHLDIFVGGVRVDPQAFIRTRLNIPLPPPPAPAPTPPPVPEFPRGEDDMYFLVRKDGENTVWLSNLVTRRSISSSGELSNVQTILSKNGVANTSVAVVPGLSSYGVAVN